MAFDNNETLFSEDEYLAFPDETKRKLARFLSAGDFGEDVHVTFEEMKLLRHAAGRLRNDSLKSACESLECDTETDAEEPSAPDCYSTLALNQMMGSSEFDQCSQVYHVTIVRDRNNSTLACVYEVISGYCYASKIKKDSVQHCVSACRCLKDDAPYIFVKTCRENCETNLRYDIIMNKWKKISKNSKKLSFQPYVTEIQDSLYVFGGQSLDIRKFVHGKWQPCAALMRSVFKPMYVVVGSKLMIFEGSSVQVFDAITNKVKLFDTFTLPQGVAVNIVNHACVISTSAIVQFDETTGACSLHTLDSTLLKNSRLIGAICHHRKIHVITHKDSSLRMLRLSLDDLSMEEVCAMDMPPRSRSFSVLSSCIVHSSQNYRLSPFLNFDEARKLNRRLASS